MSERRKLVSLKSARTEAEAQRDRRDQTLSLREQRKESHLAKRRMTRLQDTFFPSAQAPASGEHAPQDHVLPCTLNDSFEYILSVDPTRHLQGMKALRELLSVSHAPHDRVLARRDVVQRVVDFLSRRGEPELQQEAAWCVTALTSTSTEPTLLIVDAGALPPLVHLLDAPSPALVNQAAWALGNISGDVPTIRDRVIAAGCIPPLQRLLAATPLKGAAPPSEVELNVLRNASWMLSNLCRGSPGAPEEAIGALLPTLEHLLRAGDEEIVLNTAWALTFVTGRSSRAIQAVVESGCVAQAMRLTLHPSVKVASPCLRVLGNVTFGEPEHTQFLLDGGVVDYLKTLVRSGNPTVVREATWVTSNIAAGTEQHVASLTQSGLMAYIIELLASPIKQIRREAVWGIANATCEGSFEDMQALIEDGAVEGLIEYLSNSFTTHSNNVRTDSIALEALGNFLKHGAGDIADANPVAERIERCGGFSTLDRLQQHTSSVIFDLASQLLLEYFDVDPEGSASAGDDEYF